jgi:hypothetical protein
VRHALTQGPTEAAFAAANVNRPARARGNRLQDHSVVVDIVVPPLAWHDWHLPATATPRWKEPAWYDRRFGIKRDGMNDIALRTPTCGPPGPHLAPSERGQFGLTRPDSPRETPYGRLSGERSTAIAQAPSSIQVALADAAVLVVLG